MVDEGQFVRMADKTIADLFDRLEEEIGETAEVDLHEGVLTVALDGGGQYVINKNAPNRQIWLSSPVSGAAHFGYDDERGWISTRGGERLLAILEREFSAAAGSAIVLG
ncbi:MAG: iron donor protein CyaY [Rhodospirillales bacterium]|nr:iron donor protein CyaY [Rhodospirillales bacterium]